MNSEISPIPEPDNANFEPVELENEQQTQSATESRSEDTYNWSESEDISSDTDTIEIILESPTVKSIEADLSEPTDELETPENLKTEPELFADSWLEESAVKIPEINSPTEISSQNVATDPAVLTSLEDRKIALQQEIAALQTQKEQMLLQQVKEVQENIGRMVEEGTRELKERKTSLQIEIEKLERRKERINQEMRRNFAGSSQELAVRVQGFKDYLVGSLQDLAAAADKLELGQKETATPRNRERIRDRENPRRDNRDRDSRRDKDSRRDSRQDRSDRRSRNTPPQSSPTQFSEPTFAEQGRRIRQLLDKYRNSPDYYGSPWQLRRTLEANQAKRAQDWFFVQGGRGAVDSMGSRLQNILVASTVVSILRTLYGDRCRVLVLTDTPENLGEWRRGLQDCLGISRSSFGANRGVVLFDSPEVLIQGAERLIKDKLLPIIIVDETEELLNLSVLKFPLWLAFASTGKSTASNYLY